MLRRPPVVHQLIHILWAHIGGHQYLWQRHGHAKQTKKERNEYYDKWCFFFEATELSGLLGFRFGNLCVLVAKLDVVVGPQGGFSLSGSWSICFVFWQLCQQKVLYPSLKQKFCHTCNGHWMRWHPNGKRSNHHSSDTSFEYDAVKLNLTIRS